jgi:hypothetical protein
VGEKRRKVDDGRLNRKTKIGEGRESGRERGGREDPSVHPFTFFVS